MQGKQYASGCWEYGCPDGCPVRASTVGVWCRPGANLWLTAPRAPVSLTRRLRRAVAVWPEEPGLTPAPTLLTTAMSPASTRSPRCLARRRHPRAAPPCAAPPCAAPPAPSLRSAACAALPLPRRLRRDACAATPHAALPRAALPRPAPPSATDRPRSASATALQRAECLKLVFIPVYALLSRTTYHYTQL